MSQVPLQVLTRPFAIEPVTHIMLPDGIFDNAIYKLQIACHFTNQSSSALTNVTLYLESVGDPGIVPVARTFTFASIPAGASVMVQWDANFQNATPGKPLISFVAKADGFDSRRSIQKIFVSQTRYDQATNSYTCAVPEGTLKVSNIGAIVSAAPWGSKGGGNCCCKGGGGDSNPGNSLWVPTGLTMEWVPNPAFSGVHGELPFADPWWKVVALIVALIAAIVSAIAAAEGQGTTSIGASGTFDETQPSVSCCTPASGGSADFTVAGVAASIATAALVVACTDAADPFWRGQENTPPLAGETTIGEKVVAKWDLPEAPNAGVPYTADVQWTYQRFTTGNTYSYSVNETQVNIHVCDNVELDTPVTVQAFEEPLWVRAKFFKDASTLFKGAQLYAFAAVRAPNNGLYFVIPLTDDGLGFDPAANDGIYAGSLDLRAAYRLLLSRGENVHGVWRVFVFAQDVNLSAPGTAPEIAAQHIGGFFVASALSITFDPTLPCPLKAQASITVV